MFGLEFPNYETIALPIGISFFTFQAISYIVDVYKDNSLVQKNILNLTLYIAFFPQLIAGPIIKYSDMEYQINNRQITLDGTTQGVRRFAFGLAKKLIISNSMGLMADTIFALDSSYINIASAWIAGITYTLQIYFDFSGYSDMAIGISRVFGFEFKENFNYPYVATSMQNFWRRWHISLSTWFKEYLYIPLGGNRKGSLRTVLNKVFVFFCTGLWHGANFTFIVWGLMHGLLLLLEYYSIIPIDKCKFRPLKHLYTMVCVVVTFVMFRAVDVSQGFMYIQQMFTGFNVSVQSLSPILELVTPSFIVTLILGIVFSMPVEKALTNAVANTKASSVLAVGEYVLTLGLVLVCILNLYTSEYNPFIYLNF
jgi:alginate O-acetyltransferase complex protein AlgI